MSVITADHPATLAERVAGDFLEWARGQAVKKPEISIALSGGATPKGFYARLAEAPYAKEIPWEKLWIFWSDERCVSPDHPDSNFGMAKSVLLDKVPVRPSQVFRMKGEDPPPVAGRAYEDTLREFFPKGFPWPEFDLIFLGMGADGHTASLVAGTPALQDGERWAVGNVIRSLSTIRLTLTVPAINHARSVWFLATGAKKAEAFARANGNPDPACPASLIRPLKGELRWYVDKAILGE